MKLFGEADPITVQKAKELLGWKAETDNVKPLPDNVLLKDLYGKKVECLNNVKNRPFYRLVCGMLMQEILMKRWRFNGEPIIIGKDGSVLNGQHTLVAVVLAAQAVETHPGKWKEFWNNEVPSIQKLVVFGVEEDDDTVNTMDTCKPRSLTDVIFRSNLFTNVNKASQVKLSRLAGAAVQLVWGRTGAGNSVYAPRRTSAESLDFIARHSKLLEAVNFIFEETDGGNSLPVSLGHAAGMLYLMGAGETDPGSYHAQTLPDEESLNFSLWDKACAFWVEVASGADSMKALRAVHTSLINNGNTGHRIHIALVCKAWEVYLSGKKLTNANVKLKFEEQDGFEVLMEDPTVGGIDMGENPEPLEESTIPEPKSTKSKKTRPSKSGSTWKPKKAKKFWGKGDVAWVHDGDSDPYLAKLIDHPYVTDNKDVLVMAVTDDKDEKEWEVNTAHLSLDAATPPEA